MPIPSAGTSSRPRAPTSESNEYKSPSACPECGATDCDKATCLGESSSRPPAYKRHKAWNGAENRDKSSNRISNRLLYCRKDDDAWVDISNDRLRNSRLGALYPGSRFKGVQRCREVSYEVSVDIQHVDIRESTLSGYLNIKGLTDEYPELTTFFQGEIIGPKYSFLTRKWQAQQVVDALHWKRFPSFQPYVDIFNNDGFVYEPYEKDFIYMRWKEHFLVPDHRVRTIDGASFAGFYYICYQRSTNEIKGYYFFRNHSDCRARFQELSLKHEEQRSFASFEFR